MCLDQNNLPSIDWMKLTKQLPAWETLRLLKRDIDPAMIVIPLTRSVEMKLVLYSYTTQNETKE